MPLEIAGVSSLPPEAAEADFSFEIDGEILAPFDEVPFRTRPLPVRCKLYGLDEALFEARDSAGEALFLAREGGEVAGYVAVSRGWNGCAVIDDIAVARPFRRQGLAGRLMDSAVRWARGEGMATLRLETQSNNVAACRFYRRYGFQLGGYDRFLYRRLEPEVAGDVALFWYLNPGPSV